MFRRSGIEFNLVQNQFSAEFGGASGGVFNAIVKTRHQPDARLVVRVPAEPQSERGGPDARCSRASAPIRASTTTVSARPSADRFARTSYSISATSSTTRSDRRRSLARRSSRLPARAFRRSAASAASARPTSGYSSNTFRWRATATDTVTVGGQSIPIGPLSFASPAYNNSYNAVAAIDWNVSTKDQVRGRYFYNRSVGLDFWPRCPYSSRRRRTSTTASRSRSSTISRRRMENELRVSYSRNNQNIGAGNFKFPWPGRVPEHQHRRPAVADRTRTRIRPAARSRTCPSCRRT